MRTMCATPKLAFSELLITLCVHDFPRAQSEARDVGVLAGGGHVGRPTSVPGPPDRRVLLPRAARGLSRNRLSQRHLEGRPVRRLVDPPGGPIDIRTPGEP